MAALSYGVSRCCNYEMAVWRSCMERRWDSSEPSGRSRGESGQEDQIAVFGKGGNSASRKLVRKKGAAE
jgi:hypothetical protein